MPEIQTASPSAAYATKNNIVYPKSRSNQLASENARANAELSTRLGLTVTGANIPLEK